ncbi:MAG: hypothetical protein H8Z69_01195 [Nanohaloarchaea archaeon]|nr:hypothetical protein [Candidatus Nanohaloarchaea archaeon]
MKLKRLELREGDKVLFNDRKQPLEVEKVEDDRALIKGSGGGEYEIYEAEDTDELLFCSRGKRRYSSYCRELRKVGEWIREGDKWTHTSGSSVRLEKNEMGYWTVDSEDIDIDREIDLPKYGYSDKEEAEKDLEKIVGKYPEGF